MRPALSIFDEFLSLASPADFARLALGFSPDSTQSRVLSSRHPRRLLCCTRQWGKSTVAAALAVHQLRYGPPGSLTLLLAPCLRQSQELLRKIAFFVRLLGLKPRGDGYNDVSILLPNGSRVVGLPGIEENIRSFSSVSLLLIDEAARVPDELYYAVRPMLAVSDGIILAMSTPAGARGFFHEAWQHRDSRWERFSVKATDCPRIPAAFLDDERRSMSDWWFRQEYLCEFVPAAAGLFAQRDLSRLIFNDTVPL